MEEKRLTRRQAIIRRRIFLSLVALVLALIIFLVVFVIVAITGKSDDAKSKNNVSSSISSTEESSEVTSEETSSVSSEETSSVSSEASSVISSTTSPVESTSEPVKLDANFGNLLLVNNDNPLPENYDNEIKGKLVEIDAKYRNNNYRTQIHKDVYPYITAMVAAAQSEGVDLRVCSPFRSSAVQRSLFQQQVEREGGDEAKAATVVARPGTSEHNSGLCADFNTPDDSFENTAMYRWMVENAEDYGFVMRYRRDKQPITGIIHESWHWRFVGINNAKQMNKLDMCLEEYVEYINNN